MPISIGYGPAPYLIGQAAYMGGQGNAQRYLMELQQRDAEQQMANYRQMQQINAARQAQLFDANERRDLTQIGYQQQNLADMRRYAYGGTQAALDRQHRMAIQDREAQRQWEMANLGYDRQAERDQYLAGVDAQRQAVEFERRRALAGDEYAFRGEESAQERAQRERMARGEQDFRQRMAEEGDWRQAGIQEGRDWRQADIEAARGERGFGYEQALAAQRAEQQRALSGDEAGYAWDRQAASLQQNADLARFNAEKQRESQLLGYEVHPRDVWQQRAEEAAAERAGQRTFQNQSDIEMLRSGLTSQRDRQLFDQELNRLDRQSELDYNSRSALGWERSLQDMISQDSRFANEGNIRASQLDAQMKMRAIQGADAAVKSKTHDWTPGQRKEMDDLLNTINNARKDPKWDPGQKNAIISQAQERYWDIRMNPAPVLPDQQPVPIEQAYGSKRFIDPDDGLEKTLDPKTGQPMVTRGYVKPITAADARQLHADAMKHATEDVLDKDGVKIGTRVNKEKYQEFVEMGEGLMRRTAIPAERQKYEEEQRRIQDEARRKIPSAVNQFSGLPTPKTLEEVQRLPPGTRFIAPDGREKIRP